jgi:hypothetical protein
VALAKFPRLAAELDVGQPLELGLQRVDPLDHGLEALELALVAVAQETLDYS